MLTGDGKYRSVSVILCARNEATNLQEGLDLIIQQEYSNFEVVLVDDGSSDETGKIMEEAANNSEHVKFYRLDIDKSKYPGKKYALQFGIEQAQNEIILVTDADCEPITKAWISEMIAPFDDQTDLVLGFGPYYKRNGIQNMNARYECVYTAIKYLSFAKAGIPYMGVGRNMAYRRKVFFDNNGFDSHIAVEVGSMEHLNAIESKLKSIDWDSFIIDHEFVTSLYIFDPNGIQLEFTCRASDHDKIMAEDASKAHQEIEDWTERTKALKVEKFGEKSLAKK